MSATQSSGFVDEDVKRAFDEAPIFQTLKDFSKYVASKFDMKDPRQLMLVREFRKALRIPNDPYSTNRVKPKHDQKTLVEIALLEKPKLANLQAATDYAKKSFPDDISSQKLLIIALRDANQIHGVPKVLPSVYD